MARRVKTKARTECWKIEIPKSVEDSFESLSSSFANEAYPVKITKVKCPVSKAKRKK